MPPCAKCETLSRKKPPINGDFLPLDPGGWPKLDKFLRLYPHTLSGYTLPCLVVWNNSFHYKWSFPEPQTLLLSYQFGPDAEPNLLQPIGLFSPDAQTALLGRIRLSAYPVRIVGVDGLFLERHPSFVSHFGVSEDRDNDNYIYRTEDLSELAGRHYSKKRNLITQATHLYSWTVEPIANDNVGACLKVLSGIRQEQKDITGGSLALDDSAIETAVRLFGNLPLHGVLIRINGLPAAVSIFEEQSPDTAVVHFERAMRNYKGLYQVINQATAKAVRECGYDFINREEDLGDPGLRQSKESYYPVKMAKAFRLTFKG